MWGSFAEFFVPQDGRRGEEVKEQQGAAGAPRESLKSEESSAFDWRFRSGGIDAGVVWVGEPPVSYGGLGEKTSQDPLTIQKWRFINVS